MRFFKTSVRFVGWLILLLLVLMASDVTAADSGQGQKTKTLSQDPWNHFYTIYAKEQLYPRTLDFDPLVTFYSADPAVASSGAGGVLFTRHRGRTQVICTEWGYAYFIDLQVTKARPLPKTAINIEEKLLYMEEGDTFSYTVSFHPKISDKYRDKVHWKSSAPDVVSVDDAGAITALSEGAAVIRCSFGSSKKDVYVNVIGDYGGNSSSITLLTDKGGEHTYTLFKQNTYNYSDHNKYIGWHGCATCSLATVLGAYYSPYEGITPDKVINGPEKTVASSEAWNREHKDRPPKGQMPLSLHGISSILDYYNVENEYVRSFGRDEAREDILNHLRTGNPIIFEVRQRNGVTGQESSRWTNSYHTMVFLGAFRDDRVLVADSIDRSWYDGGKRLLTIDLSDIIEYMYSCSSSSSSMYFSGGSSSGGYVKIFDDEG